jgi:K+-sensing histidine kinase KdpD
MGSFAAGLATGFLLGVCGTFVLLTVSAAFSTESARLFRLHSIAGTILSTVALLCIAAFCHRLSIGKDATMLVLLFAVLAVSKLEGLLNGLIATFIAAMILAYWFFPPMGLLVKSSSDRLALALFLLIATLGSRIIGGRARTTT